MTKLTQHRILATIASNPWVIPRNVRTEFSNHLLALYSINGVSLTVVKMMMEKIFEQKEFKENSMLNIIIDSYFGLVGQQLLQEVLK